LNILKRAGSKPCYFYHDCRFDFITEKLVTNLILFHHRSSYDRILFPHGFASTTIPSCSSSNLPFNAYQNQQHLVLAYFCRSHHKGQISQATSPSSDKLLQHLHVFPYLSLEFPNQKNTNRLYSKVLVNMPFDAIYSSPPLSVFHLPTNPHNIQPSYKKVSHKDPNLGVSEKCALLFALGVKKE